jgi:hypothetical protein
VVGAVGVVKLEVALQVEPKAGVLGNQIAGEGGLPTLLQDGLLHSLHAAVGLRPARPDEDVTDVELGERLSKLAGAKSEPLSELTFSSRQPRLERSSATLLARAEVNRAWAFLGRMWISAQQ